MQVKQDAGEFTVLNADVYMSDIPHCELLRVLLHLHDTSSVSQQTCGRHRRSAL